MPAVRPITAGLRELFGYEVGALMKILMSWVHLAPASRSFLAVARHNSERLE
jgi:hypothetical protein